MDPLRKICEICVICGRKIPQESAKTLVPCSQKSCDFSPLRNPKSRNPRNPPFPKWDFANSPPCLFAPKPTFSAIYSCTSIFFLNSVFILKFNIYETFSNNSQVLKKPTGPGRSPQPHRIPVGAENCTNFNTGSRNFRILFILIREFVAKTGLQQTQTINL